MMTLPTVSFDLRGKTAGQAFPGHHHIRLNGQLLNENPEHFIQQTVGHEWAHLACHFQFGARVAAHGKEWRGIMAKLGIPPNRCHTYDTSRSAIVRPPKKVLHTKTGPVRLNVPPGVPVGAPLWAYAQKVALRCHVVLPSALKTNRAWLVRWIDGVQAVKRSRGIYFPSTCA